MKKIAFVIKNSGFIRYADSLILRLGEQHRVYLLLESCISDDSDCSIENLLGKNPNIRVCQVPCNRVFGRSVFSRIGIFLDELRYIHPDYDTALDLRRRSFSSASSRIRGFLNLLVRLPPLLRRVGLSFCIRLLRALQYLAPTSPGYKRLLEEIDPDLLLPMGLVWPGSDQAGIVITARRLGIPVSYLVNSWDNLTNKGDIKFAPDRLLVWNECQKQEAIRLHYLSRRQVSVIGASLFDKWFGMKPQISRQQFLENLGIGQCKKVLVYLGSSPKISEEELEYVNRWLRSLDENGVFDDGRVGVIIRPHPMCAARWANYNSKSRNVVVFPRQNSWVVRESDRVDFFHSLFFSDIVVAANTSAVIESNILGRKVLSIDSREVRAGQSGTIHFNYLIQNEFLMVDRDFGAHCKRVQRILRGEEVVQVNTANLERFVRPFGIAIDHTNVACETVLKSIMGSAISKKHLRWLRLSEKLRSIMFGGFFVFRYFIKVGRIVARWAWHRKVRPALVARRYVLINFVLNRWKKFNPPSVGFFPTELCLSSAQKDRVRAVNLRMKSCRYEQAGALLEAYKIQKKICNLDEHNLEAVRTTCKMALELGDSKTFHSLVGRLEKSPTYEAQKDVFQKYINQPFRRNERLLYNANRKNLDYLLRFREWQETNYGVIVERLRSAEKVVIGPWMSEVGYEVLYWIPFVRRMLELANVPSSRVSIISRGGVRSWYSDLADHYFEIYDVVDSEGFLAIFSDRVQSTKKQKQHFVSEAETRLVQALVPECDFEQIIYLHPREMYREFGPIWTGFQGTNFLDAIVKPKPPAWVSLPDSIESLLPERYFAMKFYFRESFPCEEKNRQVILEAIERIGAKMPIVSLATGLKLDEHRDFMTGNSLKQVIDIHKLMKLNDNLQIQTAIIQRARGFVGTYGGLVYLANLVGIPSFGFESHAEGNRAIHLAVAHHTQRKFGPALQILRGASEFAILDKCLEGDLNGMKFKTGVNRSGGSISKMVEYQGSLPG